MRQPLLLARILAVISSTSFAANAPAAKPATPPFAITSTGFLDQGTLPVLYTCDGNDISPEFAWTGAPAKTQTFVMIASDEDAPGGTFYHWVVYNIPKSVAELPQAMEKAPAGIQIGKNSYNKLSYNGPCPPKGSAHDYTFTLYALDSKLNVPKGADAKTVLNAMQHHIVDQVKIIAQFSRWLT